MQADKVAPDTHLRGAAILSFAVQHIVRQLGGQDTMAKQLADFEHMVWLAQNYSDWTNWTGSIELGQRYRPVRFREVPDVGYLEVVGILRHEPSPLAESIALKDSVTGKRYWTSPAHIIFACEQLQDSQ